MGKGDKKSKRGKIFMGSFGVSRPARKKASDAVVVPVAKEAVAKAEPKKAPKAESKKESK